MPWAARGLTARLGRETGRCCRKRLSSVRRKNAARRRAPSVRCRTMCYMPPRALRTFAFGSVLVAPREVASTHSAGFAPVVAALCTVDLAAAPPLPRLFLNNSARSMTCAERGRSTISTSCRRAATRRATSRAGCGDTTNMSDSRLGGPHMSLGPRVPDAPAKKEWFDRPNPQHL